MATKRPTVSQLADRLAIEDLLGRYMFALDWNDMESFEDMFTPDAEFEFASGTLKGRDNIVAAIKKFKTKIGTIYTNNLHSAGRNPCSLAPFHSRKSDPHRRQIGMGSRLLV